jgi:hypothetical protein
MKMNCHAIRTKRLETGDSSPQSLFEDVVSHAVDEDARGYQTLFAAVIKNLIVTNWTPAVTTLPLPSEQARRAGYLIEFAVGKMLRNVDKKRALMALAAGLRAATQGTPYTTLYPNPAKYEYSMERNTDELARDWGLLDGAARSNILKMLKEVL